MWSYHCQKVQAEPPEHHAQKMRTAAWNVFKVQSVKGWKNNKRTILTTTQHAKQDHEAQETFARTFSEQVALNCHVPCLHGTRNISQHLATLKCKTVQPNSIGKQETANKRIKNPTQVKPASSENLHLLQASQQLATHLFAVSPAIHVLPAEDQCSPCQLKSESSKI